MTWNVKNASAHWSHVSSIAIYFIQTIPKHAIIILQFRNR